MKKLILSLLYLVVLSLGCNITKNNPRNNIYTEYFETIWQDFDRHYVFFEYKQVDWLEIYSEYSQLVANCNDYDTFISLMKNMLANLRDIHVWLKKSNGQFVQTYLPDHIINWNKTLWEAHLSTTNWHQESDSWGWFVQDSVGYIAIQQWNRNDLTPGNFDALLDSMKRFKGIVFDIRMNAGGYGPLAGSIGGRFVNDSFNCGSFQLRSGINHEDFTPRFPITYPSRGTWQFTKPIVLLMGRGCYSTSEIFAAGMNKVPHCTTIGDTTGGGLSNSRTFTLPDGTFYSIANQLIYDSDQNIVESVGVSPMIGYDWNLKVCNNGRDPLIDYALEFINGQ